MSEFSKGQWLGGCVTSFLAGCVLNMMAISLGLSINIVVVATPIAMLPGVGLMIVGKKTERRDFGHGLFVGGCVMALLGGLCGAIFTATQVGHR